MEKTCKTKDGVIQKVLSDSEINFLANAGDRDAKIEILKRNLKTAKNDTEKIQVLIEHITTS